MGLERGPQSTADNFNDSVLIVRCAIGCNAIPYSGKNQLALNLAKQPREGIGNLAVCCDTCIYILRQDSVVFGGF